MTQRPLRVTRRPEFLFSDDKRVIPRYLDFVHPPRIRSIVRRVLELGPRRVRALLRQVQAGFHGRHRDLEAAFRENYRLVAAHLRNISGISDARELLIGAYFTMEYSIDAAALFNPSIVPHPDQSGVARGSVRFLMSLRATGEGHVSSIVFRRGVIDAQANLTFDPPPRFAHSARPAPERLLDKAAYSRRLHSHGLAEGPAETVLEHLPQAFAVPQLRSALNRLRRSGAIGPGFRRLASTMLWLARANYELHFPPDCLPSETVIFPATRYERRGMEDVRLVRFVGDDGDVTYYGTYTAYDGLQVYPMLLKTRDFHVFEVSTLSGRFARNKGMALFPRKVDGHYLMLSRHDGENIHLLRSRDLTVWNASQKLMSPREDWELVQLGNCGSPLETDAGWLVVTHAVGPVRRYCISAALLDRDDPSRVIGRLRQPLLRPTEAEREGYVPNVLYSCGSMIHRGRLIIPYAMADSRTSFATVRVRSLLKRLLESGP